MQSFSVRDCLATSSRTALSLSAVSGRAVRCKITFTMSLPWLVPSIRGGERQRCTPGALFKPQLADDLDDRIGQCGEFVGTDRKRGRQIDDPAERTDEHPLLHEPRPQRLNIGDPIELD